jgi:hypothetical protein
MIPCHGFWDEGITSGYETIFFSGCLAFGSAALLPPLTSPCLLVDCQFPFGAALRTLLPPPSHSENNQIYSIIFDEQRQQFLSPGLPLTLALHAILK